MQNPFSWPPSQSQIEDSSLHAFLTRHSLRDYDALVKRADADPAWFWDAVFRYHDIRFDTPYASVVAWPNGPERPKWCLGGTTNIVLNCIDRHEGTEVWDKPALIGVGEDGATATLTYAELGQRIDALAGLLRRQGGGRGDVVALYLPMIPEAAVAMFAIMKTGGLAPEGRDLSALRSVVSAGEPWTEEAWLWFFEEVGKRRVPILNYAGGTECGGAILLGTMHHRARPGSFGGPVPGAGVDIVDADGVSVGPDTIGELVMRQASIGLTRELWNEPERYIEAYWRRIPGMWVQGDLASRGEYGLWYLHGRSDDVIKLAGKRTGPSEIESVVMQTGLARDCAIVGVEDEVSGLALPCVYVPGTEDETEAANALIRAQVGERCGAAFRPRHFLRLAELPRTRNEKSMRRILRALFNDTPLGDISSLTNPKIIDDIRAALARQHAAAHPNA